MLLSRKALVGNGAFFNIVELAVMCPTEHRWGDKNQKDQKFFKGPPSTTARKNSENVFSVCHVKAMFNNSNSHEALSSKEMDYIEIYECKEIMQ